MSLLENIKTFIRSKDLNERAIVPPNEAWGRGMDWNASLGLLGNITVDAAMQAAIGACVRLLADDISSLPVDVYRRVQGDRVEIEPPEWVLSPSGRRWDTWQAHISAVLTSLLTDGNAFVMCYPDTYRPRYLEVLDPVSVTLTYGPEGQVVYRIHGTDYEDDRIVHIPWVRLPGKLRGLSVLDASRDSTGLEIAARQWANAFFANGATLGNVIKHPGKPTKEEVENLRKMFEDRHQGTDKAFITGILTGGADLKETTIKPIEASLEPLWKHVLEEAARIFHISPHLLASQDPGGSSFSSVEQRSIEYVVHGVTPPVTKVESAYSRLIPGADTYIKININGLLRGDFQARSQAYRALLETRVISKEAVRALEDLPKDDSEVGYLDTPNNQTRDFRTEDARALINAGFDPAAVLEVVGLPAMKHLGNIPMSLWADPDDPTKPANQSSLGIAIDARVDDFEAITEAQRASTESVSKLVGETRKMLEQTGKDQAALGARLDRLAAEMRSEQAMDLMPISRQVLRDEEGRLAAVIETQGERMRRRIIERDEDGRVVTIKEVAA